MTTPTPPSAEDMLRAVIEAQRVGGHVYWSVVLEQLKGNAKTIIRGDGSIRVLLDPQGLRAAYGDEPVAYGVSFHRPGELQKDAAFTLGPDADSFLGRRIPDSDGAWTDTPEWLAVGQDILHAWFSKPRGGAEAAIKTAYDLLPKP